MEALLKRINQLAKKSKSSEGLTEDEKVEQKKLREEYIKGFRGSLNEILLNSTVYDPEGTDVTPEKLKRAQEEMHIKNAQKTFSDKNITFLNPHDTGQEDEKEQE
ncbi:DUF896 domain-containing protein [Jeotgalibaca sp. MA1X17-3]|nr:DUF896 domain-containing protein [Jeotgalibaca sp. MA1X17-3]UJF15545.1 DUF896 domain-containing protein [Jeotgalibaca sp. MA1X17-3]